MELRELLAWLIGGGGAGVVAYWIVNAWFANLNPEPKRYAAMALTGVLAALAFFVTVQIGYAPRPETWLAWVEQVFSVIAVALGLNQVIHARVSLSKKAACC